MSTDNNSIIVPGAYVRSILVPLPEKTLFRFVGIPYNRGTLLDTYDLHGTVFDQDTFYGPPREMSAFLEHGLLPEARFEEMGRTFMVKSDDPEGYLFDVLVDRSHRYHDMLLKLYDEGILYGSAQALASGFDVDKDKRRVRAFVPGEFSFTVSPSNIFTRPIEVIRSVYLNELGLEGQTVEVNTTPTTPEGGQQATPTLAERVQAALQAQPAPPTQTGTGTVLDDVVRSTEVTAEQLTTIIATLTQLSEQLAAFNTRLNDQEAAILSVANGVSAAAQENTMRSVLQGLLASPAARAQAMRAITDSAEATQAQTQAAAPAADSTLNWGSLKLPPGVGR